MASKKDFNEQQWQLLVNAPRYAAMGVVVIDFTYVSFAKEAWEMLDFSQTAKGLYRDDPLIQDVLAELTSLDSEDNPLARKLEGDQTEPTQLADQYLEKLSQAAAILDGETLGGQALLFKRFVYEFAERVANASGEGLLGTGDKVSAKEAVFLRKLKTCLGLEP
jgi:hypothetical protein